MDYGTAGQGSTAAYGGGGSGEYRADRVREAYATAGDGRPLGCCGKGCCWWGRVKRGMA